MKDDWKPKLTRGSKVRVRRTFRDEKGNPYHFDHNKGEFVYGMWKSSAALNPEKKQKIQQPKEDGNKDYGKLL
ncbi:hypothetical protein ACFLUG_04185 [Chloroflexota bacterium]